MTLTSRDRRALIGLAAALVVAVAVYVSTGQDTESAAVVAPVRSIPVGEQQLKRLEKVAAAVPGKQQILRRVEAELAAREKSVVSWATAQQAQAHVVQVLRTMGRSQTPPLEFRGVELGQVRKFGEHYGEALVTVTFDAGIEQVVNLLADISAQKELISTHEMRIGQAHAKQKTVPVRLTVSAIVPKTLVPAKKGPGTL